MTEFTFDELMWLFQVMLDAHAKRTDDDHFFLDQAKQVATILVKHAEAKP